MIKVVAAVFLKDQKILLFRKKLHLSNGGLWEFPGGKVEINETPELALGREIKEELSIEIEVGDFIGENLYKNISLLAYRVNWLAGEIKLKDHDLSQWFKLEEVVEVMLAPADVPIFRKLLECK